MSHRDVVMPTPGLLRTGLKPEQQALVLRGAFPLVAPGREKMQGKKKKITKKTQLCSKSLSLSGVGTTQCWHKEDPLSFCLGSCLIFWSAGGKSITATEPLLCRGMRAPLRLLRAPIRTGVFKMLLSIPSSPLFFLSLLSPGPRETVY